MSARSPSDSGDDTAFDTLFICASFFGYARAISSELERRGARVLWSEDRPALDLVTKAKVRFAPRLAERQCEEFFGNLISRAAKNPIRRVLVIKGEALSPKILGRLRAILPEAEFTLYLWDSFRNMPKDTPAKLPYFDRVLSFDPVDTAANPALIYRPLFFLDNYRSLPNPERSIDVLFLATLHSDRLPVTQRVGQALPPATRFRKIFYLRSAFAYRVQRLFDPALRREPEDSFTSVPLSADEIRGLIAQSRVVLDVERPVQSGYTMRTLEIMAAGRKLITTNPSVRNADFYDAENIAIVDRTNPKIDEDFIFSDYAPVQPAVIEHYSLASWVDEVLPGLQRELAA